MLEVQEGLATFRVPAYDVVSSRNEVFYNPLMRHNRDISVLLTSCIPSSYSVLCGMAGTGVRAIRYALESPRDVFANDLNPRAVSMIAENVGLNGLAMPITQSDFNTLEGKYGIIDVDPFGSPVRYLNPALRLLGKDGYLFVTATDTAALCGSSYNACRRKYDARPMKVSFCHEIGLRILIGYIVRQAAAWGYGTTPLVSFFRDHYMRVHCKVFKGKKRADASIRQLGILHYCPHCSNRECHSSPHCTCACGSRFEHAYPLWCGPLADTVTLMSMISAIPSSHLDTPDETEKFLSMLVSEVDSPFYWDSHDLSARIGIQVPKVDDIIDVIQKGGFAASKTHFSPMGFKTQAPLQDIARLLGGEIPYQ